MHSPQSPEQTSADSERDGGREREREMGLPLCCYCARGQSSLNKLATHRQIQAVGNCEGGGEKGRSGGTAPCLGVGVAWKCAFALQVGRQVHIFNVEVFEQSPRGKIL